MSPNELQMIFPIKTELSAPNNDWVTYLVFNNKIIHCGQQQIMKWAKVDNNNYKYTKQLVCLDMTESKRNARGEIFTCI